MAIETETTDLNLETALANVTEPEEGIIEVEFLEEEMQDEDTSGLVETKHDANLAEYLEEDELQTIAKQVLESTEADLAARKEWEEQIIKGLDNLGLKIEETSEPFEGACTASHPIVMENALKFEAKAISELFPSGGPVKVQILGKTTPEKVEKANRVRMFMNWQATVQMPEYFDEKEKLLLHVALCGSGFTKTYWDVNYARPVVEHVPITEFVVPPSARDLRTTPRYTHLVWRDELDFRADVRAGMYRDTDVGDPSARDESELETKLREIQGLGSNWTEDTGYMLYEQHCYLQLEKFGDITPSPYIVTVIKGTDKVVAIRRDWDEEDPNREKVMYFTHYKFAPGFTFYGNGFISLLGNLAATINAGIRSLVDSGQFANLQGGFKLKGVRVTNNDPIAPGTWKEIEAAGQDLSKALYPLQYKEPSQTLLKMVTDLIAAGQKFADSTEQVIADSTNYGPVGTTLALLDASTKFFSAVHKRLHKAQGEELKLLARLNKKYLPDEYPFLMEQDEQTLARSDFSDDMNIVPVSDPNIPSQAHRVAINTMIMEVAKQYPQIINAEEAIRRGFMDMAIPEPEKLFRQQQPPKPLDPLSDIMAATKGQPIAAFPEQDHKAHIAVKSAWLNDPANGANPVMAQFVPIISANVREHMVMQWQMEVGAMQAQQMTMQEAAKQVMQANEMLVEQEEVNAEELAIKQYDAETKRRAEGKDLLLGLLDFVVKNRDQDTKEALAAGKLMKDTADVVDSKQTRNEQTALKLIEMLADMQSDREDKAIRREANAGKRVAGKKKLDNGS